ncbi:MAG: porin family protein [Bacteroides sp.]|nr:porin family protein [Bacteroidales bacterium]MBD5249598.1 porin family protein [Barnesiella sp.]MBD5344582.1 porin family protein [Bacteroides sp.]MBD5369054.1 porin family protein [Bacteroides sp.]
MKSIKSFLLVFVLMLGTASAANAQFRFGVKAGVAINSMKFDKSAFDSDNRAGFLGGLTAQFTVPVIGVGADLSALYVRRSAKFMLDNEYESTNRDYIEIPLNLRWNIGLPGVGKIVSPFITTGPSVAILCSKSAYEDFKNKKTDWAWNFGLGVQLFNKVQIGASYGLGLTKAVKVFDSAQQSAGIPGKNRYWTITAAYLF